jgi:peptide deformylase
VNDSQPHPVVQEDTAASDGTSGEAAVDQSDPAATSAPEPGRTGREAEDPAGVIPGAAGGVASEEDAAAEERRARALAQIRTFGDPVLKSRASEVKRFGPELERDAERMIEIMRGAMGVGLAATQLGVMQRLLVFAAGPDATPTAVANPEIEWLSEEALTVEEGCLSLPGIAVDVERPLYARVRGQDLSGGPLSLESAGLEARVLQHEIDHLDGVLMLDRTEREQRKGALRALREGETYAPPVEEEEPEAPSEDGGGEPA